MLTAVFFDLDGTLLPMDTKTFVEAYLGLLAKKMALWGYDPEKLVNGIWAGTAAMMSNTSGRRNEEVFWDSFEETYGLPARADEPVFLDFYENEFQAAREVCGFAPQAAKVVRHIKARGLRAALATNPVFPAIASESRVRWAGLEPGDFEYITTYENSCWSKPNTAYYKELLDKLDLQPEEVLMVGNDVSEDMAACRLGMKVFLLTPCLINKNNADISVYPRGDFDDLTAYIDSIM